jgi:hydrogenase nickel incorporation protein HypB
MGRFHRHDDGSAHSHDHVPGTGTPAHDHGFSPETAGHSHHGDSGPVAVQGDHRLGDHSGYATGPQRIEVLEHIFEENDRTAALNRQDLERHGIHAINLMSSPGAGKTALLRHTLSRLRDTVRIGVVEGDIETSIDADRLSGLGAEIALLNTGNGFGGECHLDAPMVRSALARLPLRDLRLVLIENVGNLVCPAEFEVGEHDRVMIYSITEGEEKPLKYPVMFRSATLVLINKMDLLPHLDFDLDLFVTNLQRVNPGVTMIQLSARTGAGVDAWLDWLEERLAHTTGDLEAVPAASVKHG